MMVGTKDASPVGGKTGVVAPVPINTPSLRQEIHGSQGDSAGVTAMNRSSTGGGWGSVVGAPSAGDRNGAAGGKGRERGGGGGGRSQGGDDVFTRHFPDLRAGLEQAERLDAVTKASSKVAPLRKPKPEPAKDQGPSLRPRGRVRLLYVPGTPYTTRRTHEDLLLFTELNYSSFFPLLILLLSSSALCAWYMLEMPRRTSIVLL